MKQNKPPTQIKSSRPPTAPRTAKNESRKKVQIPKDSDSDDDIYSQ